MFPFSLTTSAHPFVDSFCDPEGAGHHFTNWLGPFTPCFTDIVVIGAAHALAIVCSLASLHASLLDSRTSKYRLGTSDRRRHVAAAVLAGAALLVLALQLNARLAAHALPLVHGAAAPFEWAAYTLAALSWSLLVALFATHARAFAPASSPALWRFPPFLVLTGNLAKLRFVLQSEERSDYFAALFYAYVGLQVALCLLLLWLAPDCRKMVLVEQGTGPDPDTAAYLPLHDDEDVCPEVRAGPLSRLTFSWMGPLMKRGYRAPLTFADVWRLPPADRSATLDQRFAHFWAAERQRNPENPSLTLVCWQAVSHLFLPAIPVKMISDAAQFVAPVFINLLLSAVSSGAPDRTGYLLSLGLLAGLLTGTLADNQQFQLTMRAGYQVRSMLTHAVYHKILFLTPNARAQFSSGRLYSAIGSDVDTLQNLSQGILGFISSPVRIIGALVLLYFQLGIAAITAVAFLVLLLPVQAWLVRRQRAILRDSLAATDERAKLESELLGGVDVVKCYVWEDSFLDRIRGVRDRELWMLWRAFFIASSNTVIMLAVPAAAAVGAFGTYALLTHKALTPSQAFTSLSLLAVLRFPIANLPQLVASAVQASVALGRLQAILASPEQGEVEHLPPAGPGEAAVSLHGDFAWALDLPPSLRDLHLDLRAGQLVAVVGATGSGKSSLLSAALGLLERLGESPPRVRGRIALVPQTAFITAESVRGNVLFGAPHDPVRYAAALRAAALEPDLARFPAGDETEVGERGVTVSGGQKQRIALARAVYADADVVFLDDPLSALDARVGRRVFRDCVQGALAGRTRVLVTNQLQYVSSADRILLMRDGRIVEDGTYAELMAAGGEFVGIMSRAETEKEAGEEEVEEGAGGEESGGEEHVQDGEQSDAKNGEAVARSKLSTSTKSESSLGARRPTRAEQAEAPGARLVEEEGRSTGKVSWGIMRGYITALGGPLLVLVLLAVFIAVEAARVAAQLWLQHWTGEVDRTHGHTKRSIGFYLGMYAALSATQVVFTAISQYLARYMSLLASRRLHDAMIARLVRAPMSFFNITPLGRIVNRLTKDTSELDKNLTDYSAFFMRSVFQLASTVILVGALNPFTLWALTPILFSFVVLYQYFQTTVREVKRLDSISRSPIYTSVGEALGGLASIRAFRAERRLLARTGRALDGNVVMSLANMSANRWLSVRLESLGALAAAAAALAAVEQRGAAALLGNILSSALQITSLTNMTLRSASLAEVSFNSVERVLEYSEPPQEAAAVVPGAAPRRWPSRGALAFENVTLRYRPGLPLVLRGLSFRVPGGTTCGVVGRTGAGKSSLINALFRLVELEGGRITLDGVATDTLGLAQLRGAMALIPQQPVLFTGSVRFNLSPFAGHSDAALWAALRHAHLATAVESSPLGLDMIISEGGAPLSAGQRQLLALARALLRPTKVLILDEATASVDVETDALIQDTVRREFGECTVVAIAHRLQTVIDAHNVLVMDDGLAVEFGSAAQLLAKQDGVFTDMVRETGPASERMLRALAEQAADAVHLAVPARSGGSHLSTRSVDLLASPPPSPGGASPLRALGTHSRELVAAAGGAAAQLKKALEGLEALATGEEVYEAGGEEEEGGGTPRSHAPRPAPDGVAARGDALSAQAALARAAALVQEVSSMAQRAQRDVDELARGRPGAQWDGL